MAANSEMQQHSKTKNMTANRETQFAHSNTKKKKKPTITPKT